jgi:hypothetical protein
LGGDPPILEEVFAQQFSSGLAAAYSEGRFFQQVGDFFLLPFKLSLVESLPYGLSCLWLFGMPALFSTPRNRFVLRACVFATASYLIWFFLTQRGDRYLTPMLPLLAMAPILGLQALQATKIRAFAALVVGGIILAQLWTQAATFLREDAVGFLIEPSLDDDYFQKQLPHYRALTWLNERGLEEERRFGVSSIRDVLFIGEARTYGAKFNAVAPTVFNHHPLEQGLDPSVSHIVYNRFELQRWQVVYGPMGWPLGERFHRWMSENRDLRLRKVYDAFPEEPDNIVVYEVRR